MVSISVVMPVYNTPVPILKEAVESILNQSFQDFEFIIIDDDSDGETAAYLLALSDPRIKFLRNKENIGITKSLNIGFRVAQGKYIARMDADDISCRERFEKQYAYMESHPDVVLCGCAIEEFGSKSGQYFTRLNDPEEYRIKSLFYYPGPLHPTLFIRKDILDAFHISYNEELKYAQDYGLLVDISHAGGRIYNLPEVLLMRRNHEKRITFQYYGTQKKCAMKTQTKLLCELLGSVSVDEAALHYRYFYEKSVHGGSDACKCVKWALKLIRANHRVGIYSKAKFDLYTIKLLLLVIGQSFMPSISAAIISCRNRLLIHGSKH